MLRLKFQRCIYSELAMLPCKNPDAKRRHPERNMHFTIEVQEVAANPRYNILRAELSRRETAEEMQEFIRALNAEIQRSGHNRTLIWVRHSRPIFKAEHYAGLARLATNPGIRVALVADSMELRASHHYVELPTSPHAANLPGFHHQPTT